MKINIFGIFMSKNVDKVIVKNQYMDIDLGAYNKANRVDVVRPALYSFDSFVEDAKNENQ